LFLDNTEKKVIAAFAIEFSFFVFCFEIFRYKIFKFSDLFFRELEIFINPIRVKYVCGSSTSRNPLKTVRIPPTNTKKVQDPPQIYIHTTTIKDIDAQRTSKIPLPHTPTPKL
tara:strand:+ start:215 stop:553 length:339 start_codon:yes stop_codon:yes gene_type:complete